MKSEAISKVKMRLQRAATALEAIRNATTLQELEPAWTDYLSAHNSIFTILGRARKANRKIVNGLEPKSNFAKKTRSLTTFIRREMPTNMAFRR